jgi:hypothetical protein
MPACFADLQLAFEFVSSGATGENEAYLDRQSGSIYCHSEYGDNAEELPDDIDGENYIAIPDKRRLHLGKALVLDFVAQFLPDDHDEVRLSSAEEALTPDTRPYWWNGARSSTGTIFRIRPRKPRCGSGARKTGSSSATDPWDKDGLPRQRGVCAEATHNLKTDSCPSLRGASDEAISIGGARPA